MYSKTIAMFLILLIFLTPYTFAVSESSEKSSISLPIEFPKDALTIFKLVERNNGNFSTEQQISSIKSIISPQSATDTLMSIPLFYIHCKTLGKDILEMRSLLVYYILDFDKIYENMKDLDIYSLCLEIKRYEESGINGISELITPLTLKMIHNSSQNRDTIEKIINIMSSTDYDFNTCLLASIADASNINYACSIIDTFIKKNPDLEKMNDQMLETKKTIISNKDKKRYPIKSIITQ